MLQDESKLLAETANRAAGDFVLVSRAHLLGQLIVVVVYHSLSLSLSPCPFVLGCFVFSFVGCFSNFVCRAFVDILQHLLHSKVFVATLFFLFWPQTAAVQLAPSNLLDRARKGRKDREAAARRNRENFSDQLAMALKWTSRNCNYCVTQIRIARFVFLSLSLSLSARFAAVFTFPLACNVV